MTVVYDVHKLTAPSAAMLYSFMDQVNAHRKSVFIFTLTTEDFASVSMPRQAQDLLAEKALHKAWKDHIDLSHRSPLVSRMTSNAVVIWSARQGREEFNERHSITKSFFDFFA